MKKIIFLILFMSFSLLLFCSNEQDSILLKKISGLDFKLEQTINIIRFVESHNDSIFNKLIDQDSIFIKRNKVLSESIAKTSNGLLLYNRKVQQILLSIDELDTFKEILITRIDSLNKNMKSINESLSFLSSNISNVKMDTQNQIEDIHFKISRNTFYWMIIIFVVILMIIAVFLVMKKKVFKSNKNLFNQIENTKKYLDKEAIKLDSKLIEILESQIRETKDENKEVTEIDHSLPIQVGLEIFRMRKRIKYMPEDTKGINALKNALERLEDEFNSKGYEVVDLLNKPYNDGLTVEAKFFPSEKLKLGDQIISKVIKPQINYKCKLINQAKIEVTEGV